MTDVGVTSPAGGGTDNPSLNFVWVKVNGVPGSNGTLNSITIHCKTNPSGPAAAAVAAALYTDSAGAPAALVGANNTGTATAAGLANVVVTIAGSPAITSGAQYWIGIRCPGNTTGPGDPDVLVDFGTATGTELYFRDNAAGANFPASTGGTFDGSDNTERWTAFFTYTPTGGAAAPPTLMLMGVGT